MDNAIFNRRSVRTYLDKPIEEHKIKQLLAAAMQAPSANNQQPWDFIVLRERKNIDHLADYSPYALALRRAPLAIVVMTDTRRITLPGMWQQDLGAATQNILLEAVNQDLGAVWLGVEGMGNLPDNVSAIFNLPNYVKPFAVISIGYPANENANRYIDRFEPSRIHWEKY